MLNESDEQLYKKRIKIENTNQKNKSIQKVKFCI